VEVRPTAAVSQAADSTVGREFSPGVELVVALEELHLLEIARKNMELLDQVSLHLLLGQALNMAVLVSQGLLEAFPQVIRTRAPVEVLVMELLLEMAQGIRVSLA
jgi:hypothetical protein